MDHEQQHGEQARVAVQRADREARQPGHRPTGPGRDPERDDQGQQDQRHHPGAPPEVPQRVRHCARSRRPGADPDDPSVGGDQPGRAAPSRAASAAPGRRARRPPWTPRWRRRTGRRPRRRCATRVGAGWPVRGSTMWCTLRPPCRQARPTVLDVASAAPAEMATVQPGSPAPSLTRTDQPPSGAGAGRGDVAAEADQGADPEPAATSAAQRSAAHALAVAPRSSRVPAGTVRFPPLQAHAAPAGARRGRLRATVACGHQGEVPVVAEPHHRRTHGRVDVPAGTGGGRQCGGDQFGQPGAHRYRPATGPVHAHHLGVGAEPAGGQLDLGQLARPPVAWRQRSRRDR